jgi:beta-lactam-binding protein with PASTA domain
MKIVLRISFAFLLGLALTWGLSFFFSDPAAAQKTMPNVVGMSLDQAKTALAEAGGVTSIEYYSPRPTNDNSQDQKVIAQTPAPGQPITGMVVLGYYQFQGYIPNVEGMTLNQAKSVLIQSGVPGNMINITPIPTNTPSLDQKVFAQTPAPGQPIAGRVVLEYYRR